MRKFLDKLFRPRKEKAPCEIQSVAIVQVLREKVLEKRNGVDTSNGYNLQTVTAPIKDKGSFWGITKG